MVKSLNKYIERGHFIFKSGDILSEVCNSPRNCSGLYMIYGYKSKIKELIYIGISGRKGGDGNIKHRKDGLRGRFLTGKQFGNRRQLSWPLQMKVDKLDKIEIHWFVTHGKYNNDFPRDVEISLLQDYLVANGRLPLWNKEI
ncbi:MAG: hypothetical protein K0Q95_3367 [Bacteroidota bacterium]|jgi:hypothetical protein|nr:hypothetical protein [Bacteroidota bacterium]